MLFNNFDTKERFLAFKFFFSFDCFFFFVSSSLCFCNSDGATKQNKNMQSKSTNKIDHSAFRKRRASAV